VLPGLMPELPGRSWAVGVIADAAAPSRRDLTPRPVLEAALAVDAAMIAAQSGLRVEAVAVTADNGTDLATRLHRLPLELGAIFLTRTEPSRAGQAQRALAELGGRPLITDDDAVAITVTAAVLTYLNRLSRPTPAARVVILGPNKLPVMCPLLLATGMCQITPWNPGESKAPLPRVCRDADVVINLFGAHPAITQVAWDRPCGSVIATGGEHHRLLALPGLFRAIAGSVGPLVDIEAYHACARGLVEATPPGLSLPRALNPVITYQVATAASLVVNPVLPSWRGTT
jgi:hypothetical protein